MRKVLPFLAPVVVVFLAGTVSAADDEGFIGIKVGSEADAKGIAVLEVVKDGPADKGGLKANDVITKKDGKAVGTVPDFVKAIHGHKPGDKVTLTIDRDGKEMEIKITVGKPPADKG